MRGQLANFPYFKAETTKPLEGTRVLVSHGNFRSKVILADLGTVATETMVWRDPWSILEQYRTVQNKSLFSSLGIAVKQASATTFTSKSFMKHYETEH